MKKFLFFLLLLSFAGCVTEKVYYKPNGVKYTIRKNNSTRFWSNDIVRLKKGTYKIIWFINEFNDDTISIQIDRKIIYKNIITTNQSTGTTEAIKKVIYTKDKVPHEISIIISDDTITIPFEPKYKMLMIWKTPNNIILEHTNSVYKSM